VGKRQVAIGNDSPVVLPIDSFDFGDTFTMAVFRQFSSQPNVHDFAHLSAIDGPAA
jgi:hypothetical protein